MLRDEDSDDAALILGSAAEADDGDDDMLSWQFKFKFLGLWSLAAEFLVLVPYIPGYRPLLSIRYVYVCKTVVSAIDGANVGVYSR